MQHGEIISKLSTLSKSYSEKLKEELEQRGLKISYCKLLSSLAEEDGGTQLSLVERTGIKAPTVSIMLRKMEKLGLVTRKIDDYDLRKTHVWLTEKGRETDIFIKDIVKELQEDIFGSISEKDLDVFCKILDAMASRLK